MTRYESVSVDTATTLNVPPFVSDWIARAANDRAARAERFLLDILDRTPPEHRWRLVIIGEHRLRLTNMWTPPVVASQIPDVIGGIPYNTRPPHLAMYDNIRSKAS